MKNQLPGVRSRLPFPGKRLLLRSFFAFCFLSGIGLLAYRFGSPPLPEPLQAQEKPGSQQSGRDLGHEKLAATLWQQTSGEYVAVAQQIYALAQMRLEEALADKTWSAAVEQRAGFAELPPAVMLDLDETVFDNSCYEGRIIKTYGQYSQETFEAWCRESQAAAVPGVQGFLNRAAGKGVAIFYTSGRTTALAKATADNLRNLELPLRAGVDGLLLDDGTTLEERRAKLAARYRILLLVGDNLSDFVGGTKLKPAERRKLAETYQAKWGREWIILPNPIYGHWEAAFYNFDYATPRQEMLRQKHAYLNTCKASN